MSHQAASNGGFRWQEISRAKFQETTASILGQQKQDLENLKIKQQGSAAKIQAQGEFMADMSMRLDEHAKTLSIHQSSFQAWGERNFMARLRWVFRGR